LFKALNEWELGHVKSLKDKSKYISDLAEERRAVQE
jgi:hypothetical protein